MKKMLAVFYSLTFLCLSCTTSSLPADEYLKFVESPDNGLHIVKEEKGIKMELQYKPLDYMLYQEIKSRQITSESFRERQLEMKDYYYFTLKLASQDKTPLLEKKGNNQENSDRLSYCEFNMQKDFALVAGKDTFPCEVYQFERNFNLAPFNNFVLAFPENHTPQYSDLTLLYRDKLFGLGTQSFHIKGDDLKNIPAIKNL
jgi:hypothetical protein